jgi:deoxyadenosine/deoxycytidine kinase
MRVEICGGIASGKTTLASALSELGCVAVLERFQDNPFFDKFYIDRDSYAFETEITFLLQHYSLMREASNDSIAAADCSLALDLAYAEVTLEPADRTAFTSVLRRALEKIGSPTLIVRLDCDSSVQLARIRARARAGEEAIDVSYLNAIDSALDDVLAGRWFASAPVVRIDSHVSDFRPGGPDRHAVLRRVSDALRTVIVDPRSK